MHVNRTPFQTKSIISQIIHHVRSKGMKKKHKILLENYENSSNAKGIPNPSSTGFKQICKMTSLYEQLQFDTER